MSEISAIVLNLIVFHWVKAEGKKEGLENTRWMLWETSARLPVHLDIELLLTIWTPTRSRFCKPVRTLALFKHLHAMIVTRWREEPKSPASSAILQLLHLPWGSTTLVKRPHTLHQSTCQVHVKFPSHLMLAWTHSLWLVDLKTKILWTCQKILLAWRFVELIWHPSQS